MFRQYQTLLKPAKAFTVSDQKLPNLSKDLQTIFIQSEVREITQQ